MAHLNNNNNNNNICLCCLALINIRRAQHTGRQAVGGSGHPEGKREEASERATGRKG